VLGATAGSGAAAGGAGSAGSPAAGVLGREKRTVSVLTGTCAFARRSGAAPSSAAISSSIVCQRADGSFSIAPAITSATSSDTSGRMSRTSGSSWWR